MLMRVRDIKGSRRKIKEVKEDDEIILCNLCVYDMKR